MYPSQVKYPNLDSYQPVHISSQGFRTIVNCPPVANVGQWSLETYDQLGPMDGGCSPPGAFPDSPCTTPSPPPFSHSLGDACGFLEQFYYNTNQPMRPMQPKLRQHTGAHHPMETFSSTAYNRPHSQHQPQQSRLYRQEQARQEQARWVQELHCGEQYQQTHQHVQQGSYREHKQQRYRHVYHQQQPKSKKVQFASGGLEPNSMDAANPTNPYSLDAIMASPEHRQAFWDWYRLEVTAGETYAD